MKKNSLQSTIEYWNEQREEISTWFNKSAPSLGELYKGAVILLYTNSLPGRYRFISHAVREISNRLPEVIGSYNRPKHLDYKSQLDIIAEIWTKETSNIVYETYNTPPSFILSQRLFSEINSLVKDHLRTRMIPKEATLSLFQSLLEDNEVSMSLVSPAVKQWVDITKWFMSKTHDSGNTDVKMNLEDFMRHFELFETSILALIGSIYKPLEELDEILEEANS